MKNHNIDFTRQSHFTLYPTLFTEKMVIMQFLFTTLFVLFIIIGDYIFSKTESCDLFPHNFGFRDTKYSSLVRRQWNKH